MKNIKSNQSVISAKVDNSKKEELEKLAEERGLNVSELVREILMQAQESKSVETIEKQEVKKEEDVKPNIINEENLVLIGGLIERIVKSSIPPSIVISPEREYLKRIIGKSVDENLILTKEEEEYLQRLSLAVKADVTETLLNEYKSVPIVFDNKLKQKMFEKMVDVRNTLVDQKRPNLQTVFQKAVIQAFFDDCSSLYTRNLFKVTYGFTYDEFRAVFSED